jgi:hypothetical protein
MSESDSSEIVDVSMEESSSFVAKKMTKRAPQIQIDDSSSEDGGSGSDDGKSLLREVVFHNKNSGLKH